MSSCLPWRIGCQWRWGGRAVLLGAHFLFAGGGRDRPSSYVVVVLCLPRVFVFALVVLLRCCGCVVLALRRCVAPMPFGWPPAGGVHCSRAPPPVGLRGACCLVVVVVVVVVVVGGFVIVVVFVWLLWLL